VGKAAARTYTNTRKRKEGKVSQHQGDPCQRVMEVQKSRRDQSVEGKHQAADKR